MAVQASGLFLAALACGCSMAAPEAMIGTYPAATAEVDRMRAMARGAQSASLFPADEAVLSGDLVSRALDTPFKLPARARIAVIRIGPQIWGFWTEDVARLDQGVTEKFITALRDSPRVAFAGMVPSILMPPRITVPLLREAAARTQSDLVLLYQVTSHQYARSRAFRPDETRAYCIVEAFLLDTRSGLIPFTSVQTESYAAQRDRQDISFQETMHKAAVSAAGRALDKVAAEVVAFLAETPASSNR